MNKKKYFTYIAGSSTTGGVNADNTISNNTIVVIALSIAHDRDVMDHLEGGADRVGRVRRLTPANNGNHFSDIARMSSSRQTAGLDVVIEGDGLWQLNKGNVVGKGVVIPILVSEAIEGSDFNTVGLVALTDIVGTSKDVEVQSILQKIS